MILMLNTVRVIFIVQVPVLGSLGIEASGPRVPLSTPLTLHPSSGLPPAIAASSSSQDVSQAPHSASALVFFSGCAEHDTLLMFRTHSFLFLYLVPMLPLGESFPWCSCEELSPVHNRELASAFLSHERSEYEWVVGGERGTEKHYKGEGAH